MLSSSPSRFQKVPVYFPNFGSSSITLTAADHLNNVKIKFMRMSLLFFGLLLSRRPQGWMSSRCQIPIYLLPAELPTLLCCERSTYSSLVVQTPVFFPLIHHARTTEQPSLQGAAVWCLLLTETTKKLCKQSPSDEGQTDPWRLFLKSMKGLMGPFHLWV